MDIPKIKQISINMTINNKNKIIEPLLALELITGQKAKILKAKKSISSFNLRKDMHIGVKVTLHRENMNNFLNKLVYIALPNIREFKGFSLKNIDNGYNYTFRFKICLFFQK